MNRALPHLMIAAILVLSLYGQMIFKARALVHSRAHTEGGLPYLIAMFSDIGVWSGLFGAVIASVCWMLAIQRLELGYAFLFMSLSFVLVPLGSAFLFHENLSTQQIIAMALIVAGVALNAITH
ncbi:MAG: EamA family transporter [Reyranella sp.]|nr:EamA family transporter [Reyranella sp.]